MAILIGSLAVITGVPFNVGMWVQTKLYKGDGEIRNDAIVGIPGYTIDFPPFDPSAPYEASYHLYHVPQRILDNSPYVFLRFHSTLPFLETLAIEKRVSATFHLALTDAHGRLLQRAELPFATSTWEEESNLYGVYELHQSQLQLEWNQKYVLHVSYIPGNMPPPAKTLYFSIENGGRK